MKVTPVPLILIVDDEPAVLYTTKLILQSKGYTVAGVATSQEALQLLKAVYFDLLLLDCIPGNARVAQEGRRINPGMRIAICSGNPDRYAQPPADDVIEKPIPAIDLLQRVATLLRHSGAA